MLPAFPTRAERYGYAAALSLTVARLVLAVPFIWIGVATSSGKPAAVVLALGFISDVYDGIVARRFGVATAGLRRLDSAVDTVFYLAAAFCLWRLHPEAMLSHRWLIAAVIATLVIDHAFEFRKFGREASYHAWLAKAWGASLFAALVFLFVAGDAWLLTVALWIGIASHVENFVITLLLTECRSDVKSVFHVARSSRAGVPRAALDRDDDLPKDHKLVGR
jgi:CDP-diacylglycerol--glycerol-3-phosphate 3-phosphatidyltransferase